MMEFWLPEANIADLSQVNGKLESNTSCVIGVRKWNMKSVHISTIFCGYVAICSRCHFYVFRQELHITLECFISRILWSNVIWTLNKEYDWFRHKSKLDVQCLLIKADNVIIFVLKMKGLSNWLILKMSLKAIFQSIAMTSYMCKQRHNVIVIESYL